MPFKHPNWNFLFAYNVPNRMWYSVSHGYLSTSFGAHLTAISIDTLPQGAKVAKDSPSESRGNAYEPYIVKISGKR